MVKKFRARAHFRARWAPEYSGHCIKNTPKIAIFRILPYSQCARNSARAPNFFWLNSPKSEDTSMMLNECKRMKNGIFSLRWSLTIFRKSPKNRKKIENFQKKSIFLTKKFFWFYFDFGWIPIILRYLNVSWTFWHRYERWHMTTILSNFSGIILTLFAKKK